MNKIVWSIVISLVCLNQVMAATVVVEPDDFSVGTDVRNSFPGVTLSTTLPGDDTVQTMEEVLVRDGYDAFLNRNVATTGTSVFGQPIDPNTSNFPGQIFGQTDFGLLRADFASPASFVQIDLIFGDDGVARLWAYDSSGNELEYREAVGDGRVAGQEFGRVSITRGNSDIAYILAGGVGREPCFLDNLIFTSEATASTVNIDIDPKGNNRECSNKKQVVIFGQADFDVTTININTLEFADVNGVNGRVPNCRALYVNEDEMLDLVCKFIPGYGEATLTGELDDGTPFEGSDVICAAQ